MNSQADDLISLMERRNKLESNKDDLIRRVEDFFVRRNTAYNNRPLPEENKLGNNQFQDLTAKAGMTTSVMEIIIFIRYQVGRDREKKGWASNNFGTELINEITEVSRIAENDSKLKIELVRLFLGYLQRHVRFLRAL